jgi:hypothetical protein
MRTRLKRKIEEGRAKLPVERQEEIDANILQKREEFKLWNLQKVLYEAANENKDKNLHFKTIKEWAEIFHLKQSAFKREKALNRKDRFKGSLIITKHASVRMTQRGITMWDMANDRVTIINSGKYVITVYRH